MKFTGSIFLVFLVVVFGIVAKGQPMVPSLCIFGDSVVDSGNNNNLYTLIKANFPPYGRDFANHNPTGRFCNGKLATDFTAEYLGFNSYPPAYFSQEGNNGNSILAGANFASAASGYYDNTPQLYRAITLEQQLENYREWQSKVVSLVGKEKGNNIISGGISIVSAGTSDFIQNYYVNPMLSRAYTPDQFSDFLMQSYSRFIQNLYGLGARRIGVTNLPPTGCLPASITVYGGGNNQCVERMNQDAISYNKKLTATSQSLKSKLPGLKLVVFDIYTPLLDLIINPSQNGFFESRRACCGTGTMETSYLCNAGSVGTCSNATGYVFWDGFHPSQAANEKLAQNLLIQGFDLIS